MTVWHCKPRIYEYADQNKLAKEMYTVYLNLFLFSFFLYGFRPPFTPLILFFICYFPNLSTVYFSFSLSPSFSSSFFPLSLLLWEVIFLVFRFVSLNILYALQIPMNDAISAWFTLFFVVNGTYAANNTPETRSFP